MSDAPDAPRDELIARALRDLPVPDHRPTFWSELDGALGDPATTSGPDAVPDDPPVHRLDTGELPSVTSLAPRTGRRRAPVLAAAAAVVVLVGLVGLVLVASDGGEGGDDDTELADGQDAVTTTLATMSEQTTTVDVRSTPPRPATTVSPLEDSATQAVMAWLQAVGEGEVEAAAALTGPRTTSYLEASTDGVAAYLREAAEGYGAWVAAPDLQVDEIPLGTLEAVGGEVTIVVVSGTNPGEGREGPTTDVFPVVNAGDGWLVEHLAFDPTRDDNDPIVQIPRVPAGQSGLGSMAAGEAIEVIVPASGTVYFRVDDGELASRATSPVGQNNDPYARHDPQGTLAAGDHELLVVGIGDDGTIAYTAGPFVVQG